MSDYSIHVENGKVIGDSFFYRIANDLLGKESGLPTGDNEPYRRVGIGVRDGGWGLDFPNAYCGHDPYGMNERIGAASLRMEAERLAKVEAKEAAEKKKQEEKEKARIEAEKAKEEEQARIVEEAKAKLAASKAKEEKKNKK